MDKKKKSESSQVAFRLPTELRRFYEDVAQKDRRRLSDALRIALEDRAKQIREEQAA